MRHFVEVLKAPTDCTNNGVTSKATHAILLDGEDALGTPEGLPLLRVVRRTLRGALYVHAEPLSGPAGSCGPMAGGNFVYSCDSRFRQHVCAYPISVHDRFETPEEYRRLSS